MKLIKNVVCKMVAILSRPQCVNLRGSIIIIITKAVSTAAAVLTMRTNIIIHYCDVIIGAVASQITNPMIVYSTVYPDKDQSKHQSSASLAFVWEFTGDPRIPRTNGQ